MGSKSVRSKWKPSRLRPLICSNTFHICITHSLRWLPPTGDKAYENLGFHRLGPEDWAETCRKAVKPVWLPKSRQQASTHSTIPRSVANTGISRFQTAGHMLPAAGLQIPYPVPRSVPNYGYGLPTGAPMLPAAGLQSRNQASSPMYPVSRSVQNHGTGLQTTTPMIPAAQGQGERDDVSQTRPR